MNSTLDNNIEEIPITDEETDKEADLEEHNSDDDDFLILDKDDVNVKSKLVTKSDSPPKIVTKIIIQKNPFELELATRVWTAFITFHLFLIPSLIGLMLGLMISFENANAEDYNVAVKYNLILSIIGISVMVGLPFHVMSLGELEDLIFELKNEEKPEENEEESAGHDSLFEVSDCSSESSLSLADGDSIQKVVTGIP